MDRATHSITDHGKLELATDETQIFTNEEINNFDSRDDD